MAEDGRPLSCKLQLSRDLVNRGAPIGAVGHRRTSSVFGKRFSLSGPPKDATRPTLLHNRLDSVDLLNCDWVAQSSYITGDCGQLDNWI